MPFPVLVLLSVLFAFNAPAFSAPQDCSDPDKTITLAGQAAVDSWATSFGCTTLQGDLFVQDSSPPVTDLSPLKTLTRIEGKLFLGSAGGLSNLTSLGVASVDGLGNLTTLGSLTISNMPVLSDISALSNLTTLSCPLVGPSPSNCLSGISIQKTPLLTDIGALGAISTREINSLALESVPIADLKQLLDLPQGLSNVRIENLPLATPANDAELNYLAAKANELILTDLPQVATLPASTAVEIINVENLPLLTDLASLNGYPNLRSLTLSNLPQITDADLASIAGLPNPPGTANLLLVLNSMTGLTDLGGLAGITSFLNLTVQRNPNLTSLSGLSSSLTSIGTLNIIGNNALTSLIGLEALATIQVNLTVSGNAALLSLNGLDTLRGSVGGTIEVAKNPLLADVRALRQITDASALYVFDNSSLNECDVFAPISTQTKAYFRRNGPNCDATRDKALYVGPGLTIAPATFDFGAVNQGSSVTIPPPYIQVTATGSPSTQVQLGDVRIDDSNSPAWFSLDGATTCALSTVLNSGEFCVVSVSAAPLGFGPDQADLVVPYIPIPVSLPSPGPLHAALTILGDGQPSANLTPNTSLDLGVATIGASSAPQTVTVSNTGTAPLTINSITDDDPADFPISNNCGSTLAIGATCDISVTFTPTRRGSISGTLTLSSSAGPPQKLVLTGVGNAPPALSINPADLAFGGVATGSSTTLPATITNNGDDALVIGQSTFSGSDFSFNTDGCSGQTLPAGQACQLVVRFAPSIVASISGTLAIASNDPAASTVISLTGTGEEPAALQASPANLSFGEVELGSSSDLSLILTNTGGPTTSVAISSIAASAADYSLVSDACSGQSLAGGSTCALTVRFTPSVPGPDNADLEITHSLSASSPTNVGLAGSGGTPVAYINPSSIDFGDVLINTLSAATVVTIGDPTASDLTIGAIVVDDPEFRISNDNCSGQTVTSGNTCTFEVAVLPVALGGISGTISVFSDSGSSPDKVTLLANGVAAAMVRVSSPSLVFTNVSTGSSGSQSLTITNAGGFALVLGQLGVSGSTAFALGNSDTCSSQTLAPGASCAVDIEYTRTSDAEESGSLNIPSNSPQSPDVVALSAPAIAAAPVPVPGLGGPLLLLLGLLVITVAGSYTPRMRR